MTNFLAGDIGGTKTLLRLVDSQPASDSRAVPKQTVLAEATYPSHAYPDLIPMLRDFLCHAAASLAPQAACFGVAGPVVDNAVEVTNLGWSLEGKRLEKELSIPRVHLVNDFTAIGHGVLGLGKDDLHTLQEGEHDPEAPIGVIGAGTGLGEGFLIPHPTGYRVFSSEGGHKDFSPQSALEYQLLAYLKEGFHLTHVSVERVVSGMGITAIYEFLRDRELSVESKEMAVVYRAWKQEIGKERKTVDLAAEISKAATEGEDYLCRETMKLFVGAYGAEAGNLALTLLPYGGLYVAGGIAAKILPLLEREEFMKAFKAKGRMLPVLERVPVHVVLNPKVGLIGAALHAAELCDRRLDRERCRRLP